MEQLKISYYERNKEKIKKKQREYYQNNKVKIQKRHRKNSKKWYRENKSRVKKYDKKRHKENYTEDNRRRALYTQSLRSKILVLLDGQCTNPYNLNHGDFLENLDCLCIDHIDGGGTKERKNSKSYDQYLKMILEKIKFGSKDYQLLCANCNQIKRKKNKEGITFQ